MKNIHLLVLIILFTISCNRIQKEERVLIQGENEAVLVLNTPTAKCSRCQKIIEEGLLNITGVSQSILNLNSKNVSIVYNPKETSSEILNFTLKELITETPCK